MNVIFLDIDGVLNTHERFSTGYSGFNSECVRILNWIFWKLPDIKVVISSAWRYWCYNNNMNIEGMENSFSTHGLNIKGRIHGITEFDELKPDGYNWCSDEAKKLSLQERANQITKYVVDNNIKKFIVLDDLLIPLEQLIQTCSSSGITMYEATELVNKLQ